MTIGENEFGPAMVSTSMGKGGGIPVYAANGGHKAHPVATAGGQARCRHVIGTSGWPCYIPAHACFGCFLYVFLVLAPHRRLERQARVKRTTPNTRPTAGNPGGFFMPIDFRPFVLRS
jgi:hypothetical protein